jgi:hypothetical protein
MLRVLMLGFRRISIIYVISVSLLNGSLAGEKVAGV